MMEEGGAVKRFPFSTTVYQALNESTGRASPLLDRRGGCGIKKGRESSLTPQTGWWSKILEKIFARLPLIALCRVIHSLIGRAYIGVFAASQGDGVLGFQFRPAECEERTMARAGARAILFKRYSWGNHGPY